MSYDIYIPSLKIAFEYQGIQHYKPVDFFGGEEKFERQKINDALKKRISEERGINVIVWKFDEPITSETLEEKIEKNGRKVL